MPTAWKQGFKALGVVRSVERGEKYNDESTTVVDISYIFPDAVSRTDILRDAPAAYYWCSALPVIGLDDHSNQTIRMITQDSERSELKAFFFVLRAVCPDFRQNSVIAYPELEPLFDYMVPNPRGFYGEETATHEYTREELVAMDNKEFIFTSLDIMSRHRLLTATLCQLLKAGSSVLYYSGTIIYTVFFISVRQEQPMKNSERECRMRRAVPVIMQTHTALARTNTMFPPNGVPIGRMPEEPSLTGCLNCF